MDHFLIGWHHNLALGSGQLLVFSDLSNSEDGLLTLNVKPVLTAAIPPERPACVRLDPIIAAVRQCGVYMSTSRAYADNQ